MKKMSILLMVMYAMTFTIPLQAEDPEGLKYIKKFYKELEKEIDKKYPTDEQRMEAMMAISMKDALMYDHNKWYDSFDFARVIRDLNLKNKAKLRLLKAKIGDWETKKEMMENALAYFESIGGAESWDIMDRIFKRIMKSEGYIFYSLPEVNEHVTAQMAVYGMYHAMGVEYKKENL